MFTLSIGFRKKIMRKKSKKKRNSFPFAIINWYKEEKKSRAIEEKKNIKVLQEMKI